jgi:hypothetical protein
VQIPSPPPITPSPPFVTVGGAATHSFCDVASAVGILLGAARWGGSGARSPSYCCDGARWQWPNALAQMDGSGRAGSTRSCTLLASVRGNKGGSTRITWEPRWQTASGLATTSSSSPEVVSLDGIRGGGSWDPTLIFGGEDPVDDVPRPHSWRIMEASRDVATLSKTSSFFASSLHSGVADLAGCRRVSWGATSSA